MRTLTRVLVTSALAVVLFQSTGMAKAQAAPTAAGVVSGLTGRGTLTQAACLGCASAIVASGGLTWGGLLVVSFFYADAVVSCGYICYAGFIAD
ncbi:MAG TPA: hypothetical protein VLA36_15390 [Longimicrobiales bacterium]|nr:hypothetical protein [Longimicrobiales bacterium]